jgi:Flp pilus assembly protein TadG
MLQAISRLLAALRHGTSGAIAPMFGVLLVPLVGLAGAAVDYSVANKIRSELQAAADAASIGAIAYSSAAYAAATSMPSDGAVSAGATDAKNIFKAQIVGKTGFTLGTLSATVAKSNGSLTSTVQFSAQVPMNLMKIVGISSLTVTGSSAGTHPLPIFVDFHLLLDNTPSMGVAATPADVAKMVNNTPDQCAFACHDLSTSNNYYNLAKSLGVTTRIDVLRTATQQLMDTATGTQDYPGQFRMAIHTFGSSASLGLTTITPLTSSLSTAKSAAANIDLMTVPYQNYNNDQDTDFNDIMPSVNKAISAPGNGQSSATPQKVLFFISDGVADASVGGNRTIAPIDTALCTAIKSRGIKIAVLYTTYLNLPTNNWYMTWLNPFNTGPYGPSPNSQIALNMQACASPGLYFEVSPTQGISDAMTALFQKAVADARISG